MANKTPLKFSKFLHAFFVLIFSATLYLDLTQNTFSLLRVIQNSIIISSDLAIAKTNSFFQSALANKKNYQKLVKDLEQLNKKYEIELAKKYVSTKKENDQGKGLIPAKIVYFDAYKYVCCGVHEMLISNSQNKYLPVLNSDGLIGQTVEQHGNFGKLMLLSNPKHFLPVKIGKNYCSAFGKAIPHTIFCSFDNSNAFTEVLLNDEVFTSGLGGIFPKGLKVGKISEIDISEKYVEVSITLNADPRNSPNIFLLKNNEI